MRAGVSCDALDGRDVKKGRCSKYTSHMILVDARVVKLGPALLRKRHVMQLIGMPQGHYAGEDDCKDCDKQITLSNIGITLQTPLWVLRAQWL
jgi:hypothetical protein